MHGIGKDILPFSDPVLIFALALFIIFLTPIVLKKLHIPSIIGLLIAGIFIGPHGFYLIERGDSIVLLGTVGLLYIMFLAGLELDFNQFRETRNRSIVFGFLTFTVPFLIGYYVFRDLLSYPIASSVLIASMFSTHTLISYPIASRLGITRNEVVPIAIGGTIITDTAVLLVLAIVTSGSLGSANEYWWLKMGAAIIAYGFVIFYLFPRFGRWFFKKMESEGTSQFIFVLSMVFLSAFLAQLAGLEPIIGAFFAGLSLNRLIPKNSVLMSRLEFVGNAIFIPFFLISVGMIVNIQRIISGYDTLIFAGILTSIALFSKFLAALFTQWIYRFSSTQRNLLFGLSTAHAAAILAVIVTAFELGLVKEEILNGTFVIILISCLIASIVTEKAGRKIAIQETKKINNQHDTRERILVPIARLSSASALISLAEMSREVPVSSFIHPLNVVTDEEHSALKIQNNVEEIEKIISELFEAPEKIRVVSRIDLSINAGIIRAVREMMITQIVLGWSERLRTTDYFFGSILENILNNCNKMIIASRLISPLNTVQHIVVWVPEHAEYELGFRQWVRFIAQIANNCNAVLSFYGHTSSLQTLKKELARLRKSGGIQYFSDLSFEQLINEPPNLKDQDMFVAISSRKGSISYISNCDSLPGIINKVYSSNNALLIFPTQAESEQSGLIMGSDDMQIPEIIETFKKLSQGTFRKPRNKEVKRS